MLKFVYNFFLGLLLAVFVGMGVASFYPSPKAPEYPAVLEKTAAIVDDYTVEERKADEAYRRESEAYTQRLEDYSRNVSVIVLVAAVIFVVLGLVLESRVTVIADGLLLGGVFTLLYSIGRSFAGQDPKYSFMVTSAGLIVTMVVGYVKFIKTPKKASSKKK